MTSDDTVNEGVLPEEEAEPGAARTDEPGTERLHGGHGGSGVSSESEAEGDPGAGAPLAQAASPDAMAELEASNRDLTDRHLRLAAEFDNFRRRANQERMDAWARAQAELVGKLLDTLDDLQRVSDLDPESATAPSILEGVELVERKFLRTLLDAGIVELNPEGEPFDPNVMEAVMRAPTDDPEMDDLVAMVFQRGYSFKGLLVRPARVSVHKAG